MIGRRGRMLQFVVERDELRAELWTHGRVAWSTNAQFRTPEELSDAVGQVITALPPEAAGSRAELRVGRPRLQYRELAELPRLRAGATRALVAHQSSRFFRQNGHPLITDARWRAPAADAPGRVCAIAVEEDWIQFLLDEVTRRGIPVANVGPAIEGPLAAMTLWPGSAKQAKAAREQRSRRRLTVTAALVWLAVGFASIGQLIHEQRALEQDLKTLSGPLATVSQVRREMAGAERMLAGVEGAELDRTQIPGELIALSSALPESAMLSVLLLSLNGEGSLGGSAPRALEVVAALDRRAAVVTPRLEGVPIRDPTQIPARERFTIQFGARKVR